MTVAGEVVRLAACEDVGHGLGAGLGDGEGGVDGRLSPSWPAGRRVAVTLTVSRGPTRLGFTAMVVDASATWHSPSTSRSTRTAAIPRTMRRLSRSERFAGLAESWPLGDG